MKKIETSKKMLFFACAVFIIVIFSCLGLFIYATLNYVAMDWTGIVALLTVSGSVCSASIIAYENKAKIENVTKIKRSFLKEKYSILKNIGVLNLERAQQEVDNEISVIDGKLDMAEEETIDANYNQIM